MKSTSREFCRFVLWGGLNTLASYLVYALLLVVLPYLVAYSLAYVLGILFSYLLNSKFVFKRALSVSKAVQYPFVYLAQYLLGAICLYLLVQTLGLHKLVAPILVLSLTIPVGYFMSRRIIKGKAENA